MLLSSTLVYFGVGVYFLQVYKDALLISKIYEPALNFLLITSALQVAMSFISCIYLYKKYIDKIQKPIVNIKSYLNVLTKKETPEGKLKIESAFSNIKEVSLLIKILISYWRMDHQKTNKEVLKLQKKVKALNLKKVS